MFQHGHPMPKRRQLIKPKKKKKAFLSALQLPATKEVQKKLKALQKLGVYEPKWNPALKSNWTTARVREVEKRFYKFQGDAKIAIGHRPVYPLKRGKRGWQLSDQFRFRKGNLKTNTNVARFGITKTQTGAIIPRVLGRVTVDPKTGELYLSSKHGKAKRGKRTYTLSAEDALLVLHYATESRKSRSKNARGKELFNEVFKDIEKGENFYSIDFFGTTIDVGSLQDLRRFAMQYAAKISAMPSKQIGAFTVERFKA
jgi:hypothetical protein